MNQTLFIDFECQDPYIDEGLGAGWVFNHEGRFKVLCTAYATEDEQVELTNSLHHLRHLVASSTRLVAHNAQYEIGVLHALGIPYDHLEVIDTLLLAKLFDNTLFSYGLNDLAKKYLNDNKSDDGLGEVAKKLGLVKSKQQNPVLVAKRNMNKIYEAAPDVVEEYAKQDVYLLKDLFNFYRRNLYKGVDISFYSDLIKCLVKARARGVRVDVEKARDIRQQLSQKIQDLKQTIDNIAPGINVDSSKQLSAFFDQQGIEYPLTEKGNPSITTHWLQETDHPIAQSIVRFKKYQKAARDFLDPILDRVKPGVKYTYVHPEINIFGAAATGRASASNPNIQQIPKRDPEVGKLIRTIYVPHEGETWYSLDFSSQEPRIAVHYAAVLNAPGVETVVEMYRKNPKTDLHSEVAKMMGLSGKDGRNLAKVINLGLSYGMGIQKLADSLGVSVPKAKYYKDLYFSVAPYLEVLDLLTRKSISSKGYLTTLNGRRIRNEVGFERKALNKLIQSAAADQTWTALVHAYRSNVPILFPVHDEINISTANPEDAQKLKEIMETSTPLLVPSYTEITSGQSWGECE